MVPLTGVEPVRFLGRGILSPLCLPIPPQRHICILKQRYFIILSRSRQAPRAAGGKLRETAAENGGGSSNCRTNVQKNVI